MLWAAHSAAVTARSSALRPSMFGFREPKLSCSRFVCLFVVIVALRAIVRTKAVGFTVRAHTRESTAAKSSRYEKRDSAEPYCDSTQTKNNDTHPPPPTATQTLTPSLSLAQSHMTVTSQSRRWLHTTVAGTGTLHSPTPSSHCCALHCSDSVWAADVSPTSTRQPMAVNVQPHSAAVLPLSAAMPVPHKAQQELSQ